MANALVVCPASRATPSRSTGGCATLLAAGGASASRGRVAARRRAAPTSSPPASTPSAGPLAGALRGGGARAASSRRSRSDAPEQAPPAPACAASTQGLHPPARRAARGEPRGAAAGPRGAATCGRFLDDLAGHEERETELLTADARRLDRRRRLSADSPVAPSRGPASGSPRSRRRSACDRRSRLVLLDQPLHDLRLGEGRQVPEPRRTRTPAILRRIRRMILPLRVFGRPEAMWITSGAAKAPIMWRTCSLSAPCSCSRSAEA